MFQPVLKNKVKFFNLTLASSKRLALPNTFLCFRLLTGWGVQGQGPDLEAEGGGTVEAIAEVEVAVTLQRRTGSMWQTLDWILVKERLRNALKSMGH